MDQFKKRAFWPCAEDQPAWRWCHFDSVLEEENYFSRGGPFCSGELRISPLFRFILRLSGRQSKRMENNDTMILKNDNFIFLRDGPSDQISQRSTRLKVDDFKMILRWFQMFSRIQDGPIQETGSLAVDQPAWRWCHFDSVLEEENYSSRDGPFWSGEPRISPLEEVAFSFIWS